MAFLYETYTAPATFRSVRGFDTVRYPIPWPSGLGCGKNLQKLMLPKLGAGTEILGVRFVAVGDLVTSGTPLTPVSAELVFILNGQPVGSKGISICIIPRCMAPFSINSNVQAYVYFGQYNEFTAEVRQSWSPFGCVTGVEGLSAYIEYEYTGEPPGPPTPPLPPCEKYLKWGLLGVGAIVITGAVIKTVPALMKKE